MNKIEFHKLADAEINGLYSKIEELDKQMQLEIDILDDILTINLDDGSCYVVNKQSYAQQIWLSSPLTGAYHFDYDEVEQHWKDKSDIVLSEILLKELFN